MATSDFIVKKLFLEILLISYLGLAFARSVQPGNVQYHTASLPYAYPVQENSALLPGYYSPPIPLAYQPIEPAGTFYDRKRGILRSFPGGGVPVLVDHQKRCSNNFVGIKPHPTQRQYYYVCKTDCVIFGKCQNLQFFNGSKSQCSTYPTPDSTPVCTKPGCFAILTDCTTYYRCDAQLKPQIYSCPRNTVFSSRQEKCICSRQCCPTEVATTDSYIPQDCAHKFPPCLQEGTFRAPTDCSLYFTCVMQAKGIYLQARFKCPELKFFDTTRKVCRPQHEVACDSIQLSELVYPRRPTLSNPPVLYPSYYAMDSLVDSEYPTEYSLSCTNDDSSSSSSGSHYSSDNETTKSHPQLPMTAKPIVSIPAVNLIGIEPHTTTDDTPTQTPIKYSPTTRAAISTTSHSIHLTATPTVDSTALILMSSDQSSPISPTTEHNLFTASSVPTFSSEEPNYETKLQAASLISTPAHSPSEVSMRTSDSPTAPTILPNRISSIEETALNQATASSTRDISSSLSSSIPITTNPFVASSLPASPANSSEASQKSASQAGLHPSSTVPSATTSKPTDGSTLQSSVANTKFPTSPAEVTKLPTASITSSQPPTVHQTIPSPSITAIPTSLFTDSSSSISSIRSTTAAIASTLLTNLPVASSLDTSATDMNSTSSAHPADATTSSVSASPLTAIETTASLSSSISSTTPPGDTRRLIESNRNNSTTSSLDFTQNMLNQLYAPHTNILSLNEIRNVRSNVLNGSPTEHENKTFGDSDNIELKNVRYSNEIESELSATKSVTIISNTRNNDNDITVKNSKLSVPSVSTHNIAQKKVTQTFEESKNGIIFNEPLDNEDLEDAMEVSQDNNISSDARFHEKDKEYDTFENIFGLIKISTPTKNMSLLQSDHKASAYKTNTKPTSTAMPSSTAPNTITKTLDVDSLQIPEPFEITTVHTTQLDLHFLEENVDVDSNDLRVARNALQYTHPIKSENTESTVVNSNSGKITDNPANTTDIPKLEIAVFGNLDLTVLFCPKDCSEIHEHKYDKNVFGDQHVVGIQWDPVKSNKTMSVRTV